MSSIEKTKAQHYEITVLTTPYHHHHLDVWVPDEVVDKQAWIEGWLQQTEFAGSHIHSISKISQAVEA
jgi:hypothetical protein